MALYLGAIRFEALRFWARCSLQNPHLRLEPHALQWALICIWQVIFDPGGPGFASARELIFVHWTPLTAARKPPDEPQLS
jgi:hypothetical protein